MSGKKNKKARKRQSQGSSAMPSPHESTQAEQTKPVDRWLGLGGVAVGILLFLFAKTPLAVVFWVVVFFFILLHPVWNFWWIEESLYRRFVAVMMLAIVSFGVGYLAWPTPPIPPTPLVQSTPSSTKQQSLFSSVPSYIVSAGDGVCSLFMSVAGHNTESSPLLATPIAYLLWVRLLNDTDFKMLVDGYSVQLSDSESGPWVDTFPLPIKSSSHYCNYPGENDSTQNTRAFHAAIESTRGSVNRIKVVIDGGYTVATSSGLSCLQKCTALDIPDLENNLTTGIEPHATASGWIAVNPPLAERPTLAHHSTFYRLTIYTATGDVVSSGPLSRKPGVMVHTGDAYLRLEDSNEWDLGRFPLAYIGALERKK